ncbi:MAG TPA: hypothetical protein DEO82_04100 [Eubacterium sp.]|nr:hypothetical protein [Eubacterium sp.]
MVDFFEEMPEYDVEMFVHKKMKTTFESSLEVLTEVRPILEAQDDFSVENLNTVIMEYIQNKGIKNGQGLWPLRTATSGKQNTPCGAYEIMHIIGKNETLKRIDISIDMLKKAIG